MGRGVRETLKWVAVGAIVGLTAGVASVALVSGVGFAASTAGIATAVTMAGGGIIKGAIIGGLIGLSRALTRMPSMDMGSALDRLNVGLNPQADGKILFGTTMAATDLVFSGLREDRYVSQVIAHAAHTVHSISSSEFWIDDEKWPGQWSGVLNRITRLGTEDQPAISSPNSDWPASARFRGVAHSLYVWDFEAGEEELQPGLPTRITQQIEGCPVYDPRLDSTRGGSGAHRADDQDTWAFYDGSDPIGENWALQVATYLLGWRWQGKRVWGVGVDPDDIDWDQVMAMANVCQEEVDGKWRYRTCGVFETSNDHAGIIRQFEACIGGKVAEAGGRYYIWVPHDDLTPVGTVLDVDLIREAGMEFTPSGPLQDLFNTCRGRYIEPDELYQAVPYPDVVEDDAVTEDGRPRVKDHDFAMIQDRSIAERVAREIVRRSRFSGTWTFAMGPKGLLFRPFSVITLNCQETNNEDVTVRITGMEFTRDGIVAIEALEEDPSIYDTTEPLGTPVTQLDPSAFNPYAAYPVGNLAAVPTTVQGTGDTASDGLLVTWDVPPSMVEDTRVRYRIQGATNWTVVVASQLSSTVLSPLQSGTTYEVEARHVSRTGVRSPWAQTTGATSDNAVVRFAAETDAGNIIFFQPDPPEGAEGRVWFSTATTNFFRHAGPGPLELSNGTSLELHDGTLLEIVGGWIQIGALDALNLLNAPLEPFADNTANNPQDPAWLSALIAVQHLLPDGAIDLDVIIEQALNTRDAFVLPATVTVTPGNNYEAVVTDPLPWIGQTYHLSLSYEARVVEPSGVLSFTVSRRLNGGSWVVLGTYDGVTITGSVPALQMSGAFQLWEGRLGAGYQDSARKLDQMAVLDLSPATVEFRLVFGTSSSGAEYEVRNVNFIVEAIFWK